MIIRTERLELRPFELEDFIWFKEVTTDEEVKMLLPGVACEEDETIKENLELYANGDFVNDFYYVICNRDAKPIGMIIAVRIDNLTIDVSYFLKKEHRNLGYMIEAMKMFIKNARKINNLYKFRFVIAEENQKSLNVVKKLGADIKKVSHQHVCNL